MTTRLSRISRTLAAALIGIALSGALPRADAADPFWGERDIALGDGVSSVLTGADGEVHLFSFFGTKGSRIAAQVAGARGTGLVPALRLTRPGGTAVVTRRSLVRTRDGARIRGFELPFSGWFVLEVTARRGSGAYELTTGVNPARGLSGIVTGATGSQTFRFHAAAGTRLTAVLSPRGSGARPRIDGLLDPDGDDVPVFPSRSGARASLRDVRLAEDGMYQLRWRNAGRRGDVNLRFSFRLSPGANFDRVIPASLGRPQSHIDTGSPRIAALPGYAGSAACGQCHDTVFRDWSKTAHNLAVRPWNQPGLAGTAFNNDVNRNGRDDFQDGLALESQPAFAAYGPNAPRLSYVPSAEFPYKITIGTVTYDVVRTMGGNGLFKLRFLVKTGSHLTPSPVQYNDVAGTYAAYDPADWYDGSNLPKFTAATQVPKEKSFEARCSGCHNTGETIRVDTSTGDYLTGYADFNIGCEQCHGPGAEHVKNKGDRAEAKSTIVNPRDFLDGTEAGLAKANGVCGRCHTRGDAIDAFPGTAVKAGFGFSATKGVPKLGDPMGDYFAVTTKASDFWGRKTNPFPALPGDTWVASKSHRQQALDMAMGGHAPGDGDEPACFDCHDPHARNNPHQIVTRLRPRVAAAGKQRADGAGVLVPTRADDNSLCLTCHAGQEPFASLSVADVARIGSGSAPQTVVEAVVHHMADRGMPVDASKYDPRGSGVGNCVTCHMPLTEKTAVFTADKAGFLKGDLHAHVFHALTPRVSHLYKDNNVGMTNSCNTCHPTSQNDEVAQILADWATDDDGDGTFHGDTPRNIQNAIANAGRDGGQRCAGCHTTEGFIDIQVNEKDLTQAQVDRIVKDAIARDKGISCDACHGARKGGVIDRSTRQPLRFPKAELCGNCHNNQSVVFEDFRDRGEMVRHPMREMLLGTAGAEVPGAPPYGNTAHSNDGLFEDGCVTCHYDAERTGATHRFEPQLATCKSCHLTITSFNRTSEDYDGDASSAEGIQGEVQGLLDAVKAALLLDPQVTFSSSSNFEYAGATDHRMTGASEAQKRAAFNWYSVSFDASKGVHNALRTVQLLQRSYKELTGFDVPGAVIR